MIARKRSWIGRIVVAGMGVLVMGLSGQAVGADERVLFDFEDPAQIAAWQADTERQTSRVLSLEAPEITAGSKALKMVFTGEGSRWPGIAIGNIPQDWSAYEALKFEVYSVNPLELGVRIDDDKSVDHQSRFGYAASLSKRKTLVQIPMADIDRQLDVTKLKLLCLFLTDPPAGTTIYVDNIRLGALEAQDVKYVPAAQRKDYIPSDAVTTPVAWSLKPLPGGPIKVFSLPSVAYGREIVELGQRLDIDSHIVSWDRSWGQNTWGFGDHYGERGHRFDYKVVQQYLQMELAGANAYDVYIISTPVGWKWFPKAAREALIERVKAGAGLVLVQPYAGAVDFDASDLWSVAALTDCETDVMVEPSGYMQPPTQGLIRGKAWRAVQADHPIVKDLPLGLLPYKAMGYQQYKVAPDAKVLVASETGDPIVAVRQVGKGRVVSLAYRAFDLTPEIAQPQGGPPPVNYAYWEVGYALMARCVLWAAGRSDTFVLPEDFVRQARAEQGNPLLLEAPASVLAGAPIAVDASLLVGSDGWSIERVELRDTYGRTMARGEPGLASVTLDSGRVGTWAARVVVTAVNAAGDRVTKTADVILTPPRVVWNDYEVIMWPNERLPWQRPLIYEQMRQWGCTAVLDPSWRNDDLMRERLVNGLRIVPHGVQRRLLQINPDRFAAQKQKYELTKDKQYLQRHMVISDPAVLSAEEKELRATTERLSRLRPLAYCIGEEDSLTSYRAELDLGFAPVTLAKFRVYLKGKYKDELAALNGHWGTQFASWDAVMPMTSEEAKAHGNFAPWAEHRTFMDDEWAAIYFFYLKILQEVDHPDVLMGTSGTQVPTPHDGQDWHKVMPALNWLSSYTYGHQDEMHLHFAAGKPYITAATGYGVSAERARTLLWDRLFHGNAGAIIFWWIAIQNPDLSFCNAGVDLGDVIGELKQGVGRLVFESDRQLDPIAVRYSIPSMQAGWIATGGMDAYTNAVDAWWMALQALGYQPRFVSSQQIEEGALLDGKYRALVMPRSVSLSTAEKAQIDRMHEAGGVVMGSAVDVGVYDSDLAKYARPMVPSGYVALDPAAQQEAVARLLQEAGVDPPVLVQSPSNQPLVGLEIVRFRLDDMQMVGILRPPVGTKQVVGPDGVIRYEPDASGGLAVEPVRVAMQGTGAVYDVRRGQRIETVTSTGSSLLVNVDLPAGDATLLAVVAEEPTLTVTVPHERVAQGSEITLTVACAAPGRRVVRVTVAGPDGDDVPWLTRNVVVTDSTTIRAAVAWDDPVGAWSVVATDVVTGASAKTSFTVVETQP